MEIELRKIIALAKINAEIITRITEMRVAIWHAFQAAKAPSCSPAACPAALVQGLKTPSPLRLQQPVDVFNDKIRYECATFRDVIRLNVDMLAVARKFEFFGETKRAMHELQKFKSNFEELQQALGAIEGRINRQLGLVI